MIIKIKPPNSNEAITISPRFDDEITIGECFKGFLIPTDNNLYHVRMNDGGIEVSILVGGKLQVVSRLR